MIQLKSIDLIDGGIDPEVHAMLALWWTGHGFPVLHPSILHTAGVVAYADNVPVAAAFLYMANSTGVAMLEWIVTNPEASPMSAAKGIRVCADFLCERAKLNGYGFIMASCRQPSLARLLEGAGFTKTDENVIHLVKENK